MNTTKILAGGNTPIPGIFTDGGKIPAGANFKKEDQGFHLLNYGSSDLTLTVRLFRHTAAQSIVVILKPGIPCLEFVKEIVTAIGAGDSVNWYQ